MGVSINGNDIEIGFASRYLLDALRASEEEEVLIQMTNSLKPVYIVPTSGESFIYVILPVRLSE